MDIQALTKRDKMRRMEIKDLRKQVSKLTNLLAEMQAICAGCEEKGYNYGNR